MKVELYFGILSTFMWCKMLVSDFPVREDRRKPPISFKPKFHPEFFFFQIRAKFSALQIQCQPNTNLAYFKQKCIFLCYYVCIFWSSSCSVPVFEVHISFTLFSFPFLEAFKHLSSLFRKMSTSCFLIPMADAALR